MTCAWAPQAVIKQEPLEITAKFRAFKQSLGGRALSLTISSPESGKGDADRMSSRPSAALPKATSCPGTSDAPMSPSATSAGEPIHVVSDEMDIVDPMDNLSQDFRYGRSGEKRPVSS